MNSQFTFTYHWLRQRRTLFVSVLLTSILMCDVLFQFQWMRAPFWMVDRGLQPMQFQVRQRLVHAQNFLTYWQHGVARIADLERMNTELRTKVAEVEFLRKENQELHLQIEKTPPLQDSQWKVGQVISEYPQLGVDVGSHDGVDVGDLLFNQDVLLGRVDSVSPYFSQVQLLVDGQWPIVVKTQRGVTGIVKREHDSLIISELASDAPIDVNDIVMTQGSVVQQLPPDLYVGRVVAIESDPVHETKIAVVTQDIDPRKLSVVSILMREN